MGRYVRKHRRTILGGMIPVFFIFILAVLGLNVFPSWINKSYGVPGTPCSGTGPGTVCDVCNGEVCTVVNSTFQCVNFPNGSTNTNPNIADPFCPGGSFPGCFQNCVEQVSTGGFEFAVCQPDDGFCQGISGGEADNACRTAVCVPGPQGFLDLLNRSGCEYFAIPGSEDPNCVRCEAPVSNCGNGICEQPEEDFDSCSLDCRVPGWTGPKLDPGDSVMDDACTGVIVPSMVFPGPPFNVPVPGNPGLETCEDGDVCTSNVCNTTSDVCEVSQKLCSEDVEDLCCPEGCSPDSSDTNFDVDCQTPEVCEPSPTPTPSASPGTAFLEGSGLSGGCQLDSMADATSSAGGFALLLGSLLSLSALAAFRHFKPLG
jgi:hypothetical protein